MEPFNNPLALRLVSQGHGDVVQQLLSPERSLNRASGQTLRTCASSAASSPCSPASICSATRLTNYGADMNRDFDVLSRFEDKLGREVEHQELQAAIANFILVHGHVPSIRQLALELMEDVDAETDTGNGSEGGWMSHREASPPAEMEQLYKLQAACSLPATVLLEEPIHEGSNKSPHSSGSQPMRLLDKLAHRASPFPRAAPSPSRFSGVGVSSSKDATPLGPRRELRWPSTGGFEPQEVSQHEDQQHNVSLGVPVDADKADSVCATPPSASRPFVPGLNLFGVKKRSPNSRGGAGPAAAGATAASASAQADDAVAKAVTQPLDTSRGSPTEILRMLLPSVCKPRASSAGGALGGGQGRGLCGGPYALAQAQHAGILAGLAAVATTAESNAQLGVDERVPSFRVSMDDVDQLQTGPRRAMPSVVDCATPSVCSASKGVPVVTPDTRQTPGSRGRRQDQHHHLSHEKGLATEGVHTPAALSSIKRFPLAEVPSASRQSAGGRADAHNDRDANSSRTDCEPRKDTPGKAAASAGAAAAPVIAVNVSGTPVQRTPQDEKHANDAARSLTPVSATSQGGRTEQRRQSPGLRAVPQLRLPTLVMPPSTGPRISARGGPRPGCVGGTTARLTSRVPALPLPPAVAGQQAGQHGPLPTGARTRRRSACLPSARHHGPGNLTVRRMAAVATSGLTSHALGTVFWAESEDDMEDYDSDYEGSDGDYDEFAEDMYQLADIGFGIIDEGLEDATSDASYVFTTAAVAASEDVAARAGAALPSPIPTGTPVAQSGRRNSRRSGRGGRFRRSTATADDSDDDPDSCDLMLPEELWDAWERLSDGPKGRQYRLLESLTHVERITCTSYSSVYKACNQGQPVVVKIYDVAERDKLANAFAEIGVLLHLAGWQGAVRLLDYGRHEDKVMLMLESCDHSLKDWCDSQRFDVATGPEYILECLRLWCTLAQLLAELHERWHVAHCDLKPGNVLLSAGRLLLADFSESMLFNGTPLLLDQARGTVSYQPPEMVHGHCVDARKADVWAMGCILYEIVTGELLFKGNSDCMRAVAAGSAAAARQLLNYHRRSRGGGLGVRSSSGSLRQALQSQQHPATSAPAAAAAALSAAAERQQQVTEAAPPGGEPATAATWEAPIVGKGPPPLAPTPTPGPRVPRLPLGLARPPVPSLPSVRSQRQQPPGPPPSHPPVPQLTLQLPPHPMLSTRSNRSTSMAVSCRSQDVSTARHGGDEPPVSSRMSEMWPGQFALNTAPNTARSTARNTARSFMPYDTARSIASTTAAVWPPVPPPSAGSARSVADSEWTLAVTAAAPVAPGCNGGGGGGMSARGGASYRGCSGGSGCDNENGSGMGGAAPAAMPLPPHRRLRHSVATQCADPAGPDWLTTEEADRMRIMCDEPPSFVSLNNVGAAAAASSYSGLRQHRDYSDDIDDFGSSNATSSSSSGGGWSDRDRDEAASAGAGASVPGDEAYKPRLLSGADGPSLCDDVLGLMRSLLVEDHVRPNMRQVATMAAEVLRRHTCPTPAEPHSEEAESSLVPIANRNATTAAVDHPSGAASGGHGDKAVVQVESSSANEDTTEEEEEEVLGKQSRPPVLPPLNLLLDSMQLELSSDDVASAGDGSTVRSPADVGGKRPIAGMSNRSVMQAESERDESSPGDGSTTVKSSVGAGPAAVSLFEVCQPLQTARPSRPAARGWQGFFKMLF
ncbi:hypothetical protein Agub_g10675 [Astrephomene gubernaculifera]|uniref:Protein kinase domain-containing protein n=1 Tax=Astrephomene gubernaculifera TaxID=47775 RepID=A0AAD3DVP6_9CHLO|nr:hypothetical protein Agub_g10675 [Astrephomene gubernaculifera]